MVRGSCLCSAIEFHVMEPIKVVYNCHCWRCRHARAAAHATNGFVSRAGALRKGEGFPVIAYAANGFMKIVV